MPTGHWLQLRVSLCLVNNWPPFLPRSSFVQTMKRRMEEWRSEKNSVHPRLINLVPEQFSFYGVRLLVSCPTPSLEDQGIALRLAPTPWPVQHGCPYQLRYRRHSSQGLGWLQVLVVLILPVGGPTNSSLCRQCYFHEKYVGCYD
jgi:hypothetical protein